MFVDPCIIVQFIKKNPTRCTSVTTFYHSYFYESQHVSGDTPPIIRGLKLHWQPLVFYTWKVVGRVVGGLCQAHTERDNGYHFLDPYVIFWQPLVFHMWKVAGRVVGGLCQAQYVPDNVHHSEKPEAASAVLDCWWWVVCRPKHVEGFWTCSWWTLPGTYCVWQRPPTTHPTTFHVWKTRGCQCSFRLLMMGDVSPETCWALYKYEIITFWYIVASCWNFFMNCD